MLNVAANDNSGKPDAWKLARPGWGWGRAVMHVLHHRRVAVIERKTRRDWAEQVKKLVDEDFPKARKIVLVMDNLNTHSPASLYEAFEPSEAKRIWDRLEIHYTPKHGSWLNMAEIELSVLNHHGLSERIPSIERMRAEVSAWQNRRNKQKCKINWSFTVDKARTKMRKIYPRLDD
jgi:transposase